MCRIWELVHSYSLQLQSQKAKQSVFYLHPCSQKGPVVSACDNIQHTGGFLPPSRALVETASKNISCLR